MGSAFIFSYRYTPEESKRVKYCKGCDYASRGTGDNMYSCDYINKVGHSRPCKGSLYSSDGKCKCKSVTGKKFPKERPM